MKISVNTEVATPQAHVAINKSRLKIYNKNSETPTYYLQKGQEFQLELFNPTSVTILAKIFLNGNAISQGGLVLRPGERVFLDRYIDVAKKFLFDTYEVANTSEVKKAIEDNGDFKVEFYKEYVPNYYSGFLGFGTNGSSINTYYNSNLNLTNYNSEITYTTGSINPISANLNYNSTPEGPNIRQFRSKKSIETGRVEKGNTSKQSFTNSYQDFKYNTCHEIAFKILPLSTKNKTTEDIRQYCTECGTKTKTNFKFCPSCGNKL